MWTLEMIEHCLGMLLWLTNVWSLADHLPIKNIKMLKILLFQAANAMVYQEVLSFQGPLT